MGRQDNISNAILRAVYDDVDGKKKTYLKRIFYFFNIINISLARYEGELFQQMRREGWGFDEKDYRDSFKSEGLQSVGDLGYSGSTFFTTQDSKYLIKSIPRKSEYSFFQEMLRAYVQHNEENPTSLLVRITDFLHAPHVAIGSMLRITPAHHIVMENIMYGKDDDPMSKKWETYDLKPVSYFYPERDLAGGHLASDAVKERILDTFEDKVRVTKEQREELLDQLATDTLLLQDQNVVDYSLFLVRYPAENLDARDIPTLTARASPWRAGVKSSDGKWIYRGVILDFFWAKHKIHAQAMTALIKSFNLIGGKGHMSITTDSADYRKRFLKMVNTLFETPDEAGS